MNIVKCGGKNTNKLPPPVFQNLFKQECYKEGHTIISMRVYGNDIILAQVLRWKKNLISGREYSL